MAAPPEINPAHCKKLAKQLLAYHYPRKKITVEPLGGGITNFVFSAKAGKEDLVVRISAMREKINFFLKEQWAVAKAREKGIPVPDILEVGNDIIPLPYMIMHRIGGEESTHHPKRHDIIEEMGRLATIIHTIPTNNYGHIFDWSQNALSKNETWKDFLQCELKTKERIGILTKHKMIPAGAVSKLNKELTTMSKWKGKGCLQHGDLRLKNVMVNKEGKITAIIDWENCISSIGPYWDLSIALHDLSIDAQQRFLQGYNIDAKKAIEAGPFLRTFNMLNYAPVVQEMFNQKNKVQLEYFKARLHGAMDLYSF